MRHMTPGCQLVRCIRRARALPITRSRGVNVCNTTHTTTLPLRCLRLALPRPSRSRIGWGTGVCEVPGPGGVLVALRPLRARPDPLGLRPPRPRPGLGCWGPGRAGPPGVGWRYRSASYGVGKPPGCTGMPQGPPICVKRLTRARTGNMHVCPWGPVSRPSPSCHSLTPDACCSQSDHASARFITCQGLHAQCQSARPIAA